MCNCFVPGERAAQVPTARRTHQKLNFADNCNVRPPPMPLTLPWPLPRVPVIVPNDEEVRVLFGLANCGVLLSWKASIRNSNPDSRYTVNRLKREKLSWI